MRDLEEQGRVLTSSLALRIIRALTILSESRVLRKGGARPLCGT